MGPRHQQAVLAYLRRGVPRAEAMRAAGIPRETFYGHLRASADFRNAVLQAEEAGAAGGLRGRVATYVGDPVPRASVRAERPDAQASIHPAAVVVAVIPMLLGLLLVGLGVAPGDVRLGW